MSKDHRRKSDPFGKIMNMSFTDSVTNNDSFFGKNNNASNRPTNNNKVENFSFRRQSISITRHEGTHLNSAHLHPVELIPETSFGMIDPFHVSNAENVSMSNFLSGSARNNVASPTSTNNNNKRGRRKSSGIANDNSPWSPLHSTTDLRRNSTQVQQQQQQQQQPEASDNYYSPLFKDRTYLSGARATSARKPYEYDRYYDEEKRKSVIQKQVDAAKKRQLGEYSARALDPTAASKSKTRSKNVGLAEARRLHDPDSLAMKLSVGPKHCQEKNALKWLSKLSGDPVEEKKRDDRRTAEIAKSQVARRKMSDSESTRRMINLTSSMKNDMATFLNHLLDWASSGSAIMGRRNETEKQLAETVANREMKPGTSHNNSNSNGNQQQTTASVITNSILGLVGSATTVTMAGRSRTASGHHDNITNKNRLKSELSQEEKDDLAHETSWSFLRASSKAAGNAALTIDAFAVLKSFFDLLDADGSNSLTLDEIEAAAKQIGREESSIVAAMKSVDKDNSGAIDLPEIIKVFFPHMTLSQITRFEKTNREEISKRMDPRVRMDPEDVKDIEDTYHLLKKMPHPWRDEKGDVIPGRGCTLENMLSLMMSDFMKERPEIVTNAFELYDKDHNGYLSAAEFFDFMKFSYPPYSFRGVATKDEESFAKRRSLLSSDQQKEEELLNERKRQMQMLEDKRKKASSSGSQKELLLSSLDQQQLLNDEDYSSTAGISHALSKKMIVPNPPKTGLGTNPNSIASSWSTGNLAAITMEKQKEREKSERLELRLLRKKQKEVANSHHHHSSTSASAPSPGATRTSTKRAIAGKQQQSAEVGKTYLNSTKNSNSNNTVKSSDLINRRKSVRSSSTAEDSSARRSYASSSSISGRSSPVSSVTSGTNDINNNNDILSSSRQSSSAPGRRKKRGGSGSGKHDHDDDDDANREEFSLEALADARWKVVRENLAREPAALSTTLLMGTRDLPPVDSVKYRLIEEHYRKYGTLPEIVSAKNLMIMERDDIEQEKERDRKMALMSSAKKNFRGGSRTPSSSPTRMRMNSPVKTSNHGFDLIGKAAANALKATMSSSDGITPSSSPRTTTRNNNNSETFLNVNQSTPMRSTLSSSDLSSTKNNNNTTPSSPLYLSSSSTTTQRRNKSDGGGVEVDVETVKAATALFAKRVPTTKRLEKTLGGEYFTAGGEFSPEKVQRSKETALMLERIKTRMIVPTPPSDRY